MIDLLAKILRLLLRIHNALPSVRLDPRTCIPPGARVVRLVRVTLVINQPPDNEGSKRTSNRPDSQTGWRRESTTAQSL